MLLRASTNRRIQHLMLTSSAFVIVFLENRLPRCNTGLEIRPTVFTIYIILADSRITAFANAREPLTVRRLSRRVPPELIQSQLFVFTFLFVIHIWHRFQFHKCSGTLFEVLGIVGRQCYNTIDPLCVKFQLILLEPLSSFQPSLEIPSIQLLLSQNLKVPSLSPSPWVGQRFISRGIDIACNQRVQSLCGIA